MTLAFWVVLILAGCVGMAAGKATRAINAFMAGIGFWD